MRLTAFSILLTASAVILSAGGVSAQRTADTDGAFSDRLTTVRETALGQKQNSQAAPAVEKNSPDLPADRRAEGIGISHSGDPLDIPDYRPAEIARMLKEAGGNYYRPHIPLKEALPFIDKAAMDKLRAASSDPALLDRLTEELSKNGDWKRIDGLVDAFYSEGIKLAVVAGCGYQREAPEAELGGARTVISPDRIGRDLYMTLVKWYVGAAARRYASRIPVWQVENEINVANIHALAGWRINEASWKDRKYQLRLLRELSETVHAEGKRQSIKLRTAQNFATQTFGWESYVRDAAGAGLDIAGIDLYGNYFFGWPLKDAEMADNVRRAKRAAGGGAVWVLEAGFARAPAARGFTPERQAEYFKRLLDSSYRGGADVVLVFGWFWNPKGWYLDGGNTPQWYSPMAAEPYWSPIEKLPDGKTVFHGAWEEFKKAAQKWAPR